MSGAHPRHQLDELIQAPVRFSIMAALSGIGEAEFAFVRDTVEVSDSTLSKQVAVLEGDPAKEGAFVMRAKMPDGYKIPPHTHKKDERVTVLSGTLYLGMGGKFDDKQGKALPAGSYARTPAGMKHFGWTKGETVIQINGEGPWTIEYVDPRDDPRKSK